MINKIKSYFFPLKCMGKYHKHDFIDKEESYHVGTGKYIDRKEITELRTFHYRECNRCKLSQNWDSWVGWQLYVPIKKRIIAEIIIKDYLEGNKNN